MQWYLVSGTTAAANANDVTPPQLVYPPYGYPPIWPANQPNPNRPTLGGHLNITRRWAQNPVPWRFNLPDNLQVAANIVPDNQPITTPGIMNILLANDVFVVAGGLTATPQTPSYPYAEALWDAAILFARFSSWTATPDLPSSASWGSVTWGTGSPLNGMYAFPPGHQKADVTATIAPNERYDPVTEGNPMGIPWSNVSAVFAGYMYHLPYNLSLAGGAPAPLSGLISSVNGPAVAITFPTTGAGAWNGGSPPPAPTGGPTGDGLNEFCWCRGSLPGTLTGLTSMLVDPQTGVIQECDIVMPTTIPTATGGWGVGNPYSTPTSTSPVFTQWYAGGPPVSGSPSLGHATPSGWSILAHEIGHFFGIDHTNLIGPTGLLASPVNVVAGAATLGSPPTTMAHARWEDIPLMANTMFRTRDYVTGPPASGGIWLTHYDPVDSSAQRVQGKTGIHSMGYLHPDDVTGMCRLYPQTSVVPGTPRRPMINDLARIEGTLWNDPAEDGATGIFGRNILTFDVTTTPLDLAPDNGVVSGTHRLTSNSVIGAADISNPTTPVASSGQFIIPYVKAGGVDPLNPFGGGKERVIVVEPLGSLGILPNSPLTTPFSEWWADPVLGTQTTNPITPYPSATPALPPTTLSSYKLRPVSLGSLYCVPGTVIQLNVYETFTTAPETLSRPVVALHPRTGYTGPTQIITATVRSDFPIQQVAFIVNGVPANPDVISVTAAPVGPPYAGPYTTTFSALAQDLGVTSGSLVVATAIEQTWQASWALPADVNNVLPSLHVPGVNECRF